jgi:carbon monoxide dehydrogenase subunit G
MDQHITVTISSTSAGDLTEQVNTNMKIGPLKKSAMGKLKLDPSMAEKYVLVFNGKPLSEDSTLADLGIPNGAVLLLEPKQPEVI